MEIQLLPEVEKKIITLRNQQVTLTVMWQNYMA